VTPRHGQELRLRAIGEDDQPAGEPRYDEQTRRTMEQHLNLAGATVLTCTVYEERPLRLRRDEVRKFRESNGT
jgi:uroporphyrinogen-III synthase